MKPKYGDDKKLCYMDTDSFIIYIKTEDFYKDIADDVECKFDISNYEVDRPLPTGNNKKVIGLMKDKSGGKITKEFVALRPKTYSYLTDDCKEDKKAKVTKNYAIKRELKFNDYKDCLLHEKVMVKLQQRFKSELHDVYTEDVNKIALSSNDDKRLQTFDKIPNKRELQQIALNHSSDIDFKDFMKIFKKYTAEPYSFLVNDTTLPSDDPLRFRKNLLG